MRPQTPLACQVAKLAAPYLLSLEVFVNNLDMFPGDELPKSLAADNIYVYWAYVKDTLYSVNLSLWTISKTTYYQGDYCDSWPGFAEYVLLNLRYN